MHELISLKSTFILSPLTDLNLKDADIHETSGSENVAMPELIMNMDGLQQSATCHHAILTRIYHEPLTREMTHFLHSGEQQQYLL